MQNFSNPKALHPAITWVFVPFLIIFLILLTFRATGQAVGTDQIWINEFHYNNNGNTNGGDSNEFVEIAVSNALAANPTELAKYELVIFASGGEDLRAADANSGKGLPLDQSSALYSMAETYHSLGDSDVNGNTGFHYCDNSGLAGYNLFRKNIPNLPDLGAAFGIIYDDTDVVQLLSYDRAFKIKNDAAAGAAMGMSTTLIVNGMGNALTESSAAGTGNTATNSIGLSGTGDSYDDFTWAGGIASTATPCAVNGGQQSSAVLPVEFLDFTATTTRGGIKLNWTTARELNNSGFYVERRTGNQEPYEQLTWVDGMGTVETPTNYAWLDRDVQPAQIYYYRLRQIDTDGTTDLSKTIAARTEGAELAANLTPNPAVDVVTVSLPGLNEAAQLEIFSVDGRHLRTHSLDGDETQLSVANLDNGMYSLRITTAQTTLTQQLVVRR